MVNYTCLELLTILSIATSVVHGKLGCPLINPYQVHVGICIKECSSNADCYQGFHCCSNGCGHTCVKPVCQPVRCKMYCEFGWRSGPDGCNVCECATRDVCQGISCPDGQTCRSEGVTCNYQSCDPQPVCKACVSLDKQHCKPCPSGMIPKRDVHGCQTCECIDPCEGNKCGSGYRCVLTNAHCSNKYCDPIGVCQPSPAKCPAPMEIPPADCNQPCAGDDNCAFPYQQQKKCCATSCGNQCVKAVCPSITCTECSPGSVPMLDTYGCKTCQCYDPCRGHKCHMDQYCEPQQVNCKTTPCYPQAVCKECLANNCERCNFNNRIYKKDSRGCRICECQNPCATIRCGKKQVCKLSTSHCTYGYKCDPQPACVNQYSSGSGYITSHLTWIYISYFVLLD